MPNGGDTVIRVVVIDDSPTACRAVAAFLQADPRVDGVLTATDPVTAAAVVAAARPDVATLDLEMPPPGGLAVLTRIMATAPTPIVAVTGVTRAGSETAVRAMRLGAVDFLLKYTPGRDTDPGVFRRELVTKVVAAAGIRLIDGVPGPDSRHRPPAVVPSRPAQSVVVIGASTGGPPAIRELLAALPPGFPAAVLLAQHLPAGFTPALVAQLARFAPGEVREAAAGDEVRAGVVTVAPGGFHTTVRPDGRLDVRPAGNDLSPSIDLLVSSAAKVYGSRLHAVLLSGMGADGVAGLAAARSAGATNYAQDPAGCIIPGMPERAISRGVIDHVADPVEIGRRVGLAFAPPVGWHTTGR